MTDQPTEGQPSADHEPVAGADPDGQPVDAAAAPLPSRPAAAPAPAAAAPAPKAGRVEPPYVAAARARKRVPLWAVPIFPLLLVWALIYVNAVQPTTNANDPISKGGAIYAKSCSGCHGATGGGGSGPAFSGGAVIKTFPKWQDQVKWVNVGAKNWPTKTYGAQKKTQTGAMPGFGPQGNNGLTCDEIALVVNYERVKLAGEAPTAEADLGKLATTLATGATADIPNCPVK